jgi:DNA-binding response OmpR family regulator
MRSRKPRWVGPLDRSIDNYISNLRKKLGASAGKRECIRNGNVISCKP